MSIRVIEVMAWHSEIPGSGRHVSAIRAVRPGGATAPDLNLVNPDEWGWQDQALCAQADPELFFAPLGADAARTVAAAKRVCSACEVRIECLDFAVTNGIPYGIYGGMDERERRALGPQRLDFWPVREKGLAA